MNHDEEFLNLEKLIAEAPEVPTVVSIPPASVGQLIPITCECGKASVDARDLHAFLQVGKDFSTWISDRIHQFGFSEGQDFEKSQNLRSPNSGSAKARPQVLIEYTLSMDMAKELSMVERTDKGKQARQYFIACEKRMLEGQQSFQLPTTYLEAMELLVASEKEKAKQAEKVAGLETTVSEMTPKVVAFERISQADGTMCISNAAKCLQVRPKDFFHWLQANAWIFRRGSEWLPYQAREAQGVMDCKVTVVSRGDGSEKTCSQALVTAKGLAKLAQIFKPA